MSDRQELYCHNCQRYVQFQFDNQVDGNYTIVCPQCGHEHHRVAKGGKITGERWASSSTPTMMATSTTSAGTSIFYTSASSSQFLVYSWGSLTAFDTTTNSA